MASRTGRMPVASRIRRRGWSMRSPCSRRSRRRSAMNAGGEDEIPKSRRHPSLLAYVFDGDRPHSGQPRRLARGYGALPDVAHPFDLSEFCANVTLNPDPGGKAVCGVTPTALIDDLFINQSRRDCAPGWPEIRVPAHSQGALMPGKLFRPEQCNVEAGSNRLIAGGARVQMIS